MKATGILRRIDELGRVVIPKEIRKSMKMREGEELEIYTTEEEVVLKKYSEMSSLDSFAKSLVSAIYRVTGKAALVTDTDKVIASSGKGVVPEGTPLSESFMRALQSRRRLSYTEEKCLPFGGENVRSETIHPIMSAGDLFGAIVILSKDPQDKGDEEIAAMGAKFFEEQIGR